MALPSTTNEFLEILVKSGVLEKNVLDPYLQQMRAAGSFPDKPKKLAAVLVRDGLLTPFQVGQFLQGKWRGFCISGKYKLLDHLGAGGMGSVFLCEHKSMRRRVAIKVLPVAQAKDPASLERFYREARAVAALDHPNIVRAHDIDHDGRYHFLVLEYVEGASLQEIVKRGGPMDVTRAAHYVRQAALGLHHAHLAGLVHRNVKPSNLLVDRQGVVKILDMGLARFFYDEEDGLTQQHDEHNILGTADYLAPEQAINSHAVDIRADVYSLGATFYFLLAGKPPFGDGTVAQKLVWHQMRAPTPVRDARPETPEGLAAIVAKMMAKAPAERYQTPAEVYEGAGPLDADADPAAVGRGDAEIGPAGAERQRVRHPPIHAAPDALAERRRPCLSLRRGNLRPVALHLLAAAHRPSPDEDPHEARPPPAPAGRLGVGRRGLRGRRLRCRRAGRVPGFSPRPKALRRGRPCRPRRRWGRPLRLPRRRPTACVTSGRPSMRRPWTPTAD